MSYLKDREIWLSSVPTGNPPAGYVWVFIQNGVFVVRDSSGVDKIMASTTGTVTNATSASYVEYSNVADKPALISGSSQVSYTGLSDIPAGIVSGSAQIEEYGVFATTGSNQFDGSQAITGSLTVTGQVVAQTLNVQQVTSSIVFSSGSNIFGNSLDNTQQFTGSVSVTGSLAVAGALSSGTLTINGADNRINSGNELRFYRTDNAIYTRLYDGGNANGFVLDNRNGEGFSFQAAGTNQLRIASTGAATFSSTVTATKGFFSSNAASDSSTGLLANASTNDSSTYAAIFGSLNAGYRMVVRADGNVGIGTTSPQGLLQIGANALSNNGDASNAFNLKQTSTTAATGIYLERSGERKGYYMYIGGSLDSLTFQRNNAGTKADVMSLTRDGNIGIGTDSPATLLQVVNNSDNSQTFSSRWTASGFWSQLEVRNYSSNLNNQSSPQFRIMHNFNDDLDNGYIGFHRGSGLNGGFLSFAANGAEKVRITADNYLRMAAGTDGIQFNGDTAAANALDDYEEGTFTPSYVAGGMSVNTYGSGRNGYYTKIGRLVTVTINIMTESVSVSGANVLVIGGLPFFASNALESSNAINIANATRWGSNPPINGTVQPNSTQIELYSSFTTTTPSSDPTSVLSSDIATGSGNRNILRLTATYFTA